MIRAFGLAFAQLLDPRIWRIVALSIAVTLAVYGLLVAGLVWLLEHVQLANTPWIDSLARWGTGFGGLLLATLFFPAAVTAVMALGQDAVANAVEARHYAGLPPARAVPIRETLSAAARLLALTVILNLALLPVYLVLIFLPPLNVLAFAVANGLLLGREYFDAMALRHMNYAEAGALRRAARVRIWFAGTLTALLLTIPLVNLVGPVIATAAFVHLFEGLRRTRSG
jgi:uncharacterized protein involved in cysteine biosynthesis